MGLRQHSSTSDIGKTAAVTVGQIPAAQQLHKYVHSHDAKERGLKVTQERVRELQVV